MEIELKTALFFETEETCDHCGAALPGLLHHPYGNRAVLDVIGPGFSVHLYLCAECLEALIGRGQDVLARLRHEHVWKNHAEFGDLCQGCGIAREPTYGPQQNIWHTAVAEEGEA